MNNILLTGITGLLGSAFTVSLLRKNKNLSIYALVRSQPNKDTKERLREVIVEQCEFDDCSDEADEILKKITLIEGNTNEKSLLKDNPCLNEVDTIFHCAANVNLGSDEDGETFNGNYNGTENILSLAEKLEVGAFHHVSTAYVAGKYKGVAHEDELVADDWHNSYEKSKYYSEQLVREAGIPFSIYRPSIVVGRLSDGRIRKPLAFYRILEFLAKLKKHRCSKINKNPDEWIEMPLRLEAEPSDKVYFVPIDYVQECLVQLFIKPAQGKTYHLTGNSPVSTKDIEDVVTEVLKLKGVTVVPKIENPTRDEKLVTRFLGDLLPYFSSQTVFDLTNVKDSLGEDSVDWDISFEKLISLVKSYYNYSSSAFWL